MSLLRDIQNSAIDSSTSLATLLRKCKVLAARLKNEEFKAWIDNELNGYKEISALPSYRILHVNSKGHFSGPFNSGMKNADIPLFCIPEQFRENLSRSYLKEPIAALEALVTNSDGSTAMEPWNPDLVAYVGERIYEGMNCMQAWKVIPITSVIAAIDTVRTRILNFVLEIESEAPDAGEAEPNITPVPQEKVTQIFNTYITGTVQNVATGGSNFSQTANETHNNTQLFEQILQALTSTNASHDALTHITGIVEEMRDAKDAKSFKSSYLNLMGALSDHAQIFGPIIAPYLPALAALLP
nr:hypothetical protein [Pseudomonas chengduensis]